MIKFDEALIYSPCISWGEINNEVFVFDELHGGIYLLRKVEREIWKLIEQRHTKASIVDSVQKNCNVEVDKILKIIAKFQEEGLVKEAKL